MDRWARFPIHSMPSFAIVVTHNVLRTPKRPAVKMVAGRALNALFGVRRYHRRRRRGSPLQDSQGVIPIQSYQNKRRWGMMSLIDSPKRD